MYIQVPVDSRQFSQEFPGRHAIEPDLVIDADEGWGVVRLTVLDLPPARCSAGEVLKPSRGPQRPCSATHLRPPVSMGMYPSLITLRRSDDSSAVSGALARRVMDSRFSGWTWVSVWSALSGGTAGSMPGSPTTSSTSSGSNPASISVLAAFALATISDAAFSAFTGLGSS